jgi:RND family efflux transporter MFP subunit
MKRLIRLFSTLAVMAAVTSACGSSAPTPAAATSAGPAAPAGPVGVDAVRVVSSTLSATVPLPGELQAFEMVPVFAKVSGFVLDVSVDRGSVVKRGQVLARLEAPELMAQRAEAQAKLQSAESQLVGANAKLSADDATYRRLKAASATPGVVSGNDLEMAQHAVDADRAQVTSQQDLVAAGKEALRSVTEVAAYLDVKAPFDGVVTERNVHPGALVGPPGSARSGEPLLRVESVARLRLVVPVPENYLAGVRPGQSVDFGVSAYPGRRFSGTIARLAHVVDVKTRTMPVEIDVENGKGDLTPGAFADVRWPVSRREPTLFVPPSAVASTLDRTFVVRLRDGKAEWVDVKTGVSVGKLIEVFGDLHADDQVAVRGTDELKAGTPVTPRAPK